MTPGKLQRFKDLHAEALFVMPNPWDVGSARLLASLGFPALATTSSGHAASLGRLDQHVTLDEMLTHATSMAAAVDVPLNVDSERCFADAPSGVTTTVGLIGQTGAAGCSIEDYDPANGTVDPINKAVERVAAAAANDSRMLLTARAENHLYGLGDLDDTITRLCAFRDFPEPRSLVGDRLEDVEAGVIAALPPAYRTRARTLSTPPAWSVSSRSGRSSTKWASR